MKGGGLLEKGGCLYFDRGAYLYARILAFSLLMSYLCKKCFMEKINHPTHYQAGNDIYEVIKVIDA